MLDAVFWALPRLGAIFNIQPGGSSDDVVEYQGTSGQPGFQFYTSTHSYKVGYNLMVCSSVDELKSLLNWQAISEEWWLVQEQTLYPRLSPDG
jgi:hypothetical protein